MGEKMISKKTVYRTIIGALALTLVLGLCWTALIVWVWSPAISDHTLSKFHVGMTKDEVNAIMGKPTGIRTDKSGLEVWVYGRPLQWASFIVYFYSNGTVESFVHDE